MKARKERRPSIDHRREDEDFALVERARAGDREAFGDLFVAHAPAVRRLMISVVGPGGELDDLVQDVFLQVHRSLPRFRHQARFSSWLHRLAVNVALGHLRRLGRRPRPAEPAKMEERRGDDGAGVYERALARERLRRLYGILETLSPRRRIAFTLFAVAGKSIAEAAELAGVSPVTMKSRIWFARREVKRKARDDAYLAPLVEELSR